MTTTTNYDKKKTKNVILTILLIAPLFVSGIAVNQYVYATCIDFDGDGFCDINNGGTDCDDSDANVFPGATEVDNGIDDDCDTEIDEGFDTDGDGFTPIGGGDCNDADDTIFPGATEVLGDGVDQNCNGADTMAESEEGLFWKEVQLDCADELAISSGATQECDLWITYHVVAGEHTGTGIIIDAIPAHLDVVDPFNSDVGDTCEVEFANKHGKATSANKPRVTSATIVTCDVSEGDMIHIDTQTRESPSNAKSNNPNKVDKWSPTSCGEFEVNGGLIYFEDVDQFGIPIILDTMDPLFVHTTPDDTDCDGVPNTSDLCEGFDDAVDTDGDGVPDGCDQCLGDDASGNNDGDAFCNDIDICIDDPTNTCQD